VEVSIFNCCQGLIVHFLTVIWVGNDFEFILEIKNYFIFLEDRIKFHGFLKI